MLLPASLSILRFTESLLLTTIVYDEQEEDIADHRGNSTTIVQSEPLDLSQFPASGAPASGSGGRCASGAFLAGGPPRGAFDAFGAAWTTGAVRRVYGTECWDGALVLDSYHFRRSKSNPRDMQTHKHPPGENGTRKLLSLPRGFGGSSFRLSTGLDSTTVATFGS